MQVVFKLVVHAGIGMSSEDRIFSHVVDMPFLPPVGMEVCDGGWCATVESLCFANNQLFAFAAPNRCDARVGFRTKKTLDALSEDYIAEGWQPSDRLLGV